MQTQDEQPGEETRSGSWSVSEVAQADTDSATRAGSKAGTSKRKTSSSRKTTKKDAAKPSSTTKRKTSKTTKDDDKPKTTAKPKTATSKPKTAKPKGEAKTAASKPKAARPKSEAKTSTSKPKTAKSKSEAKTTTSKPKTTKKETGKTTTKRRSRRKQDLGDLISQLLESRASGEKGADSIVEAILEHLTKNMGLSSAAAEMVVGYILDKLVKGKKEKASAAATGEAPAPGDAGLDLSAFFGQTRSGASVDITPAAPSDELQELAQSAGLDPETIEASLGQVLKMLGEAA